VTDIQMLPSNVNAEMAVIGSCIYDRDAIFAIAPYLTVEHFYLERHRWVYDAILRCARQRIPTDYQTVGEVLRQMGHLEDIGGMDALIEYTTVVPTALHVEYYARAVLATAKGREVIQAGGQIAAAGYASQDQDELIASVTKMLQQATARPHMQGLYTAEQVDDEFESMIERGGVKAVPTGIVTLDRMLGGGFHQDELIIVGARPSVGKSWFALQLARYVAAGGGLVLFCSFEMGRVELWNRMISSESGVDSQKPRRGLVALSDADLRVITEARRKLREYPIVFEDNFGISMEGIHSAALGSRPSAGRLTS
jgi:replicative DNA helicase